MKPFYNTPGLVNPPAPDPAKVRGNAFVDKIEDEYASYRDDCNKGYCKSDPAEHAKFQERLKNARASLIK